jgi:hypothetical protein
MPPPRRVTPEQEEQIRGMASRGETYRAIGEVFGLSAATVSRIVTPPAERQPAMVGTVGARPFVARRDGAAPSPPPATASGAPPPSAEEEAPIVVPEDPRELAREDWLYYERLKMSLRRRADRELGRDNVKGYQLLLREARSAEERAQELRPPAPPDPDTDPTYRAEARKLATYLEALVSAAERGEPIPTRTLEHVEPVAALSS